MRIDRSTKSSGKLPAFEQLNGIIVGVDTLAISKTIQTVIVSGMNCDQKIAYLFEFFGRDSEQCEG